MRRTSPTSPIQSSQQAALLDDLRQRIAGLERRGGTRTEQAHLPFGHPKVDTRLPGGGLALGALHKVAGTGPDVEHGAAAALFVVGLLARLPGTVLWVMAQRDLFAPGFAGVGLRPGRVLQVEAGKPALVLHVMEEGLREWGLAGVVGEIGGRLSLTASRRLQLAAEASVAVALRRSRRPDDPALGEPSAATTR